MINDGNRYTAPHYACQSENVLVDIVSKLIEVGGRELLMMTNRNVSEATAATQQIYKNIYTAAKYGLKWRYQYMRELAEVNVDEILNGCDSSTGLRVFMVAAMGDDHDLSGIYGMMRMSPETRNTV